MYTHAELRSKVPTYQKPKPHQTMLLQLIQNHGNHIATKMQLSQRQVEIACLLYTHCDQGNPYLRVYKPFCFCLSIAYTCVIRFIKRHVYKLCAHSKMPPTYVCVGISTSCFTMCILYLCHHYRHTCSTNYGNNSGRGRWD